MLLDILASKSIFFKSYKFGLTNFNFNNIGIYSEVAIIRDAYFQRKGDVSCFMDDLTRIIIRQENVQACRLYSQLPEVLKTPSKTHARQIRQKAIAENIPLTEEENKVFGAMQGMFNAKPDLVIVVDDKLMVFEAKFTEPFDDIQLKRTWNIAEVWATLLYDDFGFKNPPEYALIKLGGEKFNPEISWEEILKIAEITYFENDCTLKALKFGVELLSKTKLNHTISIN